MLNVINVDAMVVRANVARSREGIQLDTGYLAALSADAVPALVAALPDLPDAAACVVLEALAPDDESGEQHDWRSWHVARTRARDEAARIATAREARCGRVSRSIP